MTEISPLRIHLIRVLYAFLAIGLGLQFWPELAGGIAAQPVHKSFVWSILSALALMSAIGLFAPLKMLPILLFEIAWKVIWFLSVALPRHLEGRLEEPFVENLFAIGLVLPFIVIFPWRYFYKTTMIDLISWRGTRKTPE